MKSAMPTYVKIGPQIFDIVERSAAKDGMLTDGSYGYTLDSKNLIVIDADIHISKKRVTLMHEVLHAARMVFDTGTKLKKTDDFEAWEHYFIGIWESSLLLVFKENPELLNWLLDGEK
jgi:hypothetical protein